MGMIFRCDAVKRNEPYDAYGEVSIAKYQAERSPQDNNSAVSYADWQVVGVAQV